MRYLTVQQVADELGVHAETVRRRLKSGELEGVKVGDVWMVTRNALTKFKQGGVVRRPMGRPAKKQTNGENNNEQR